MGGATSGSNPARRRLPAMSGHGSVEFVVDFPCVWWPVSIHDIPLADVTPLRMSTTVRVWRARCAGCSVIVRTVPDCNGQDAWEWGVETSETLSRYRSVYDSDAWWRFFDLRYVDPANPPKLNKKKGKHGVSAIDSYGCPTNEFSFANPTHIEGIALTGADNVFDDFKTRPFARAWTARCGGVTVVIQLWYSVSTRNWWVWAAMSPAEIEEMRRAGDWRRDLLKEQSAEPALHAPYEETRLSTPRNRAGAYLVPYEETSAATPQSRADAYLVPFEDGAVVETQAPGVAGGGSFLIAM